jgi:hypothetical protein
VQRTPEARSRSNTRRVHLHDLAVPATSAARSAFELAETFHSPALLHHCVRSYVWAAALAAQEGTEYDAELLYVAALLHDIGLTSPFEHPSTSFEEVGGQVAYVFASGASWPVRRRERVAEVVARHMGWAGDPADDREAHLLRRSTTIDVTGGGLELIPAPLRAEVLARWPRLSFAREFAAHFQVQARRGADLAAGRAVARGALERMSGNPLDVVEM